MSVILSTNWMILQKRKCQQKRASLLAKLAANIAISKQSSRCWKNSFTLASRFCVAVILISPGSLCSVTPGRGGRAPGHVSLGYSNDSLATSYFSQMASNAASVTL